MEISWRISVKDFMVDSKKLTPGTTEHFQRFMDLQLYIYQKERMIKDLLSLPNTKMADEAQLALDEAKLIMAEEFPETIK
jgi:hypothetical protein